MKEKRSEEGKYISDAIYCSGLCDIEDEFTTEGISWPNISNTILLVNTLFLPLLKSLVRCYLEQFSHMAQTVKCDFSVF